MNLTRRPNATRPTALPRTSSKRTPMHHATAAAAALLAINAAATATAQDLVPKAPPQQNAVFIVGATVHTVSGDTFEGGVVAFNNGEITIVSESDTVMRTIGLAEGTEVIDAEGLHVYPGLIAAQTQLGLVEVPSVRATRDFDEVGAFTPEVHAAVSVNPDSTLLPVARHNGVLIAGVFPDGGVIPGRASAMKLDGWTYEDMTAAPAAGLVIEWPRVRPIDAWWVTQSEAEQKKEIRQNLGRIAQFFDEASAYAAARAAGELDETDLRFEAMLDFLPGPTNTGRRNAGTTPRPTMLVASDYDQIVSALTFAKERGLNPVIVGGQDADLAAELVQQTGARVVVSGTHVFPKRDDQPHDHAYALPKRLHDAGIPFAINTADREGNVRNLPHEAGMAARFGLPRDAALHAITLGAAEALGIDDRYGSIERGKSATLIVTDGDVMEITTNVMMAFIDGRRIDLTTKQTELRDKYVEKYRQLDIIDQ